MAASAPDRSLFFPLRPRWAAFLADELIQLCRYLRARRPNANVGYPISIQRLTAGESAAATAGPVSALASLVEPVRFMSTSVALRSLLSADA